MEEYNIFEALKLCKESKEMRCPYYGRNCGLILEFDNKGYHFKGQIGYISTSELDWNSKWVINR